MGRLGDGSQKGQVRQAWMAVGGWVSNVLRPHQHSIGYTGDGFYRSKDPTNSIKVLKEENGGGAADAAPGSFFRFESNSYHHSQKSPVVRTY